VTAGHLCRLCGLQALVHCWPKCIANSGDSVGKKKCIVADNLLNQIVLLVAIVVSMIINRRHCFWSIRHRKKTKKKLVNDRSYLETI